MRMLALAAIALPLLAAKSDPLAGRVAGPPQRCIPYQQQQNMQIVDSDTILYTQSGRRTWLARTSGTCVARPLDTLIVDIYGSQLCANDRYRVLTNGTSIPGPYCRFTGFVPYDKPAKP